MSDVLIKAYHGGLGDCLQFSTLPEQFSKQQGRDTYVLDESNFRNKEIYDLVWGCNPYIKGVKSGHWNAGDIPEIRFTNENGCLLYTSPSPRDAHESRMPSSA